MKHLTLIFATFLMVELAYGQAPNTWTQKADFGGSPRAGAVGFSIGSKGYLGTGSFKKDFWEYDPAANTWTQKADFGGGDRNNAVGFGNGNKGYLGTGYLISGYTIYYYKDFWEYDPVANTWTQKANFGGTKRSHAVGFSIGSKGYLGTGYDPNVGNKKDFWEYDPDANTWTQKADFEESRSGAVGFSIESKGYLGTGNNSGPYYKDFWEYDPALNTWTQRADFGGTARNNAVGFSIGGKGYLGTGTNSATYYKDFWEYDPALNTWTQRADFGGTARHLAVGFSIGSKGYLGSGSNIGTSDNDIWEYTPIGSTAPCNITTSLSIVHVTPTTAKLQWDTVSGTIGYKVRYKIAGTPGWTTIHSIDNDKTLHELVASTEYAWQVKSICAVLPIIPSEWSEKQFFITDALRLSESIIHETMVELYPNPVSQAATVSFSLNEASPVLMEIMDVNGRSLRVIANADFSEGNHEVTFNRESLIGGIYFLQIKTNEGVMMKKMELLH